MATDLITQDRLKSLLTYDPDTGEFRWRTRRGGNAVSGSLAGARNTEGYMHIQIEGKKYKAHRLAWLYVHGQHPDEIDHVNRIKDDNRIANLRSVTHAQNGQDQSKPKNNTSGHIGVDFHKRSNRWRARIKVGGKLRDIGYFDSKEAAAKARANAETHHLPFRSQDANA